MKEKTEAQIASLMQTRDTLVKLRDTLVKLRAALKNWVFRGFPELRAGGGDMVNRPPAPFPFLAMFQNGPRLPFGRVTNETGNGQMQRQNRQQLTTIPASYWSARSCSKTLE